MTDQHHQKLDELALGGFIANQENLVKTMERIEAKMDERHRERNVFEIEVRNHISQQGSYQEKVKEHADYIRLHKPELTQLKSDVKICMDWINTKGEPMVEDVNSMRNRMYGAVIVAGLAIGSTWDTFTEFVKTLMRGTP